ncbi:porin family protein [Parabacteroides sp. PF5-9]|uniref:porin family protein n=1 Tax=Parabacteroides sp. PF5-9 TaxID=1742404 RepID=UPI00247457A6|nr:porin family protein [Parabacteroides sp. PF5-9]MDH6357177.1 opacity protein-like surface antigen [Parabacteroides sp. PF5-9]
MKRKERDILDELFRSKLYDLEAETGADDWEAIAGRLPKQTVVPLRRKIIYWSAAAVIALLMITGGLYFSEKETVTPPIAQQLEKEKEELKSRIIEEENTTPVIINSAPSEHLQQPVARIIPAKTAKQKLAKRNENTLPDHVVIAETEKENVIEQAYTEDEVSPKSDAPVKTEQEAVFVQSTPYIAEVTPIKKEKKSRKWGFGMGAGGLSMGANNIVPQYVTNTSYLRAEDLSMLNSVDFGVTELKLMELPKTDIKHKTPVSFGFSVSRYLNDRFSLQTGLTYTFLSSEWRTNGSYNMKTNQYLHFLGIPLSVTYKVAEWNRFNVYISSGVMTEVNVAGKLKNKLMNENQSGAEQKEISRYTENTRMKEWMWSVNARAGVSYPIIRFVNAFAEVGAAYYFDNGSTIETVRSEKPFNVSFQLGVRLGF